MGVTDDSDSDSAVYIYIVSEFNQLISVVVKMTFIKGNENAIGFYVQNSHSCTL